MSEEAPPPVPQQVPTVPPQPPPLVSMAPRWIGWVAASVFMPALPWLMYSEEDKEAGTGVVVMTVFALVVQLVLSSVVAVGFCRKRLIGTGGAIGMTLVFMLASVAIGTAIWFSTCLMRVTMDYK
jgi:FtsH-binding integral membrane protein